MLAADALDPTVTVKDVMAEDARTISVFQRLGLDTCCGSGLALADAARHKGIALDALLEALRAALAAE